jgi:hypothetical protein
VEKLWTSGAFPVEGLTREIIFNRMIQQSGAFGTVHRPSRPASLVCGSAMRKITRNPQQKIVTNVNSAVHRFEESIAGRAYLIEVAAVATDRWRACIVKVPGVPTALMPFYGSTPAEAAALLSAWLTRAHGQLAAPAPPATSTARRSPAS